MIARLIHACIANRVLVLVAAALLAVVGIWSVKNTPLDALPDLSDTQVIIRTQWAGQTPRIVENQVTYPLATTMLSVPGVRGHHHQHLVGALERGFQIGGGAQRERQRDTGQVARVLVLRVDRCGDHGIATPQGDGVAMPRHQRGQRRAPRPGTQHRDLQRCACLQISHPSPLCEASPP